MTYRPDHHDTTTTRDHASRSVAVPRPRLDAAKMVCYDASPYLLDLRWQSAAEQRAEHIRGAAERARRPGWFARLLDERIHLRDIRARSLSTHPRGWRDFPHASSRSLAHAVTVSVSRFFNEHPLADLTVFALLRLTGLLALRVLALPLEARFGTAAVWPSVAAPTFDVPASAPAAQRSQPRHATAGSSIHRPQLQPLPVPRRFSFAPIPTMAAMLVVPLGLAGLFAGLTIDRDAVIGHAMGGADGLREAAAAVRAMDFGAANASFAEASAAFESAHDELGMLGNALTYAATLVPADHPVTVAQPMLAIGREVSLAGTLLTRGLSALHSDRAPAEKLGIVRAHLDAALPHLTNAAQTLEHVRSDALPEELRPLAEAARSEVPAMLETLRAAVDAASFLEALLGADGTKRYLVVFQNDRELRPTGGFIGSFALLDVRDGKITGLEVPAGGSYDLQGSLREKLIAPQPLHLINPHWEFQDANWSPDFPTSAQRLVRFYEKSGGPTVDGVIAVNASFMERLLSELGPVAMPEYGAVVDADNFYITAQTEVELGYDKELNRPKQFIADMAPRMLELVSAADGATMLALGQSAHDALAHRELQLWLRDAALQERASSFGWAGELRDTDGDYLAIVHTNIAGQKTDAVMRERVSHEAKVLADGSAIVTLTIERTHGGVKGELFSGVRNVDYLRVYTPLGSELIQADGFSRPDPRLVDLPDADHLPDPEIAAQEEAMRTDRDTGTTTSTEHGKTVFGNWVQTDPGETSVVTLVYRLPSGIVRNAVPATGAFADAEVSGGDGKATLVYSLLVQKQSGAVPAEFTSRISIPREFVSVWQTPEHATDERGRLSVTETLSGDRYYGVIAQTR